MENAILMVENGQEKVSSGVERGVMMRLPIAQIDDFPEYLFKVKDDEEMEKLKDSISLYGNIGSSDVRFPSCGAPFRRALRGNRFCTYYIAHPAVEQPTPGVSASTARTVRFYNGQKALNRQQNPTLL